MVGSPRKHVLSSGVSIVSVAICILAVGRLHPLFLPSILDLGQAVFEPSGDGVIVRHSDTANDRIYPLGSRIIGDETVVAPGTALVIPIEPGSEITIRSADASRAPWALVGIKVPNVSPPAQPSEEVLALEYRLEAPHQIDMAGIEIALTPWTGSAPWKQDVERLRRVQAACPGTPGTALVRRDDLGLVVQVGSCSARFDPVQAVEPADYVVVVSGAVDGTWVAKTGVPIPRVRKFNGLVFGAAVLALAAQLLAVGLWPTACTSAIVVIAGLWAPGATAVAWLVAGLFAVVVAAGRWLAIGLRRARWRSYSLAIAVPAGLAIATFAAVGPVFMSESIDPPVPSPTTGNSECLLVGYSMAQGVTLADRSQGVGPILERECPACAGGTGRWTERGRTYSWFGARICSPLLPAETKLVIFLGGANDDFLYSNTLFGQFVPKLVAQVVAMVEPLPPGGFENLIDMAVSRHLATFETETGAIASVLSCLRERQIRFVYAHDFIVQDLRGARSPERESLLQIRRALVEGAGAEFIDLRAEFAERMGITWFNDFIHLSAVGHRHTADLLNAIIARDGPRPVAQSTNSNDGTCPSTTPLDREWSSLSP